MKKSTIRNIFNKICSFFKKRKTPYNTIYTDELPDKIDKNTIYILGEGNYLWSAAMLCPCGCGELIQLSLHKEGRPKWEIIRNKNGTVSLHPSIWRKKGCHSHYFFKNGFIQWCDVENK